VERQYQWETYLRHGGGSHYSYVFDGHVTEIIADNMDEAYRIVNDNWPAGGGMIIQSEYQDQPPPSDIGKAFAKIPESLKQAFSYLSSGYGAVCNGYRGKYLVFTHCYVFVSHVADEDGAIREFLDFRKEEEGGIIIPGGGISVRTGQFSAPRFPSMNWSNTPDTPNTPNTPSTPITPNTSIPSPISGPASWSSPQLHSPAPHPTRSGE
jgi:hypothetical protein